jgi:glucosylglycerate phosphorylase
MQTFYTTKLDQIYPAVVASRTAVRLQDMVEHYRSQIQSPVDIRLSERDAILITYADQVRQPGRQPLQVLQDFCEHHLNGLVSGIHILPFYPWSSDDGFSVTDYRSVDPSLGDWGDVERMGQSFRLMQDAVINHASVQGNWFQAFLRNELPYCNYFLAVDGEPDLSRVVRPRASPLLTRFETAVGTRQVWTTFSPDQADLDYHNPEVLLEIFDILFTYILHGAQFIRLDAIAYLWKEIGTSCIHLPQTHAIVQLLRAVLDEVAPHVYLITETNVPHADNISYFGDGYNEAQLVYNFALPPLILHTFRTSDASMLSQWAASLSLPSDRTAFYNFLASHDGIGLNPVRGILHPADIEALVQQTLDNGGLVSYKHNPDGTQSPYELNINYFNGLSDPNHPEPIEMQVDRFMAAHAIMLSLQGVPAIYFHSLFGSRSWLEGVKATGRNRSINRQKLDLLALEEELADPASLRSRVFDRFRQLLAQRASHPAFHPNGAQKILDTGRGVFSLERTSLDGHQRLLCMQNVTPYRQEVSLPGISITLQPYQTLWRAPIKP